MASIQEIKNQIQIASAIGRENLAKNEVILDENATIIEIMQGIAECKGGGVSDIDLVHRGVARTAVNMAIDVSAVGVLAE